MELSPRQFADALFNRAPLALVSFNGIARDTGQPVPAIIQAAQVAQSAGLVETWPATHSAMLSSLEAERRGLELSVDSQRNNLAMGYCWKPIGSTKPEPCRQITFTDLGGDEADENPFDVADPAGADQEFIDVEAMEEFLNQFLHGPSRPRESGRRPSNYVQAAVEHYLRIRRTIGLSYPVWSPEIEQPGLHWCPVCGGEIDDPLAVCLACSRSGLDGWIPYPLIEERPKVYNPGQLQGGTSGYYVRRVKHRHHGVV
jgi:hypothetical protein